MYVIIVYDVEVERVARVCQYLRRHLHWVQNSAFEGEITPARLERVKAELRDLIDEKKDTVYLYILQDPHAVRREVLGREKGSTSTIV
ncbi:MAG: CRISPR-associated endonuclease Cas2 [Thermoflexus sp.]|jgi:CRISPR-associated protein Cas2|nr:CRISPR-associated endonuclease Cas2 [Thermoflexus sp.]MDT7884659.1 CRISPR-associated endonuclease Cas2 [Thermoflexus sp.]MDT7948656.1 CRISPR-associated endonuclease Cas2 [Thermoflexus sp.]